MNREFSASSKQARSILAVAAVVATILMVGSIEGLSQYYPAEAQLASAKPLTVAHR